MSLEQDLRKVFPEGQRVRFHPKTEGARAKIPSGVMDGIVRGIIPMPAIDHAPDPEAPPLDRYGLQIEIKRPDGETETIILDIDDVTPHEPS